MRLFRKIFDDSVKVEKLLAEQYGQSKLSFFVFMLLRVIVLAILVLSIVKGRYDNILMCIITLVLFTLPPILERSLNTDFPVYFEVFVLLFIFSAEMLGEIGAFYVKFHFWDTMLHTTSGFMLAAFGFSLFDIACKKDNNVMKLKGKLSPLYLTFNAFSFTMTMGVLWEFFECAMDYFFGKDMQKDTIVKSFQSVMLDKTNSNIPVKVTNIHSVVIDGKPLPFDGYLDIGLLDTMKDLAVAGLGAFIFCLMAYAYLKSNGKSKLASLFIPVKRNWNKNPPDIEADLAERIADFEKELEERRANFDSELEERKKNFEAEMKRTKEEKEFEKLAAEQKGQADNNNDNKKESNKK